MIVSFRTGKRRVESKVFLFGMTAVGLGWANRAVGEDADLVRRARVSRILNVVSLSATLLPTYSLSL